MRQVLFTIPVFGGLSVFGYRRDARAGLHFLDVAGLAGAPGASISIRRSSWTWPSGSFWSGWWGAGVLLLRVLGNRYQVFVGGFAVLEGGHRLLRRADRRNRGLFRLPEITAVPVASLHGCAGAIDRHRHPVRPPGLFPQRLLLWRVCELPWAVSFPKPSPPWLHHHELRMIPQGAVESLPIHPTQIYSAIDGLVLLLLLSAYFPLRRRDGEVFGLLMVTYPITRFLIEFLRNDEGAFFAGLTISQNISVALFLSGLAFWAWLSRQPAGLHRDQAVGNEPRQAILATARS